MLNIFSDVGDSVYNFLALSVTALKPNPSPFEIFGLVPKSLVHAGLVCAKTKVYFKLGPFNLRSFDLSPGLGSHPSV